MPRSAWVLGICLLPSTIVCAGYETFLGHRHDYVGHYAAGYGGTLVAILAYFWRLPEEHFRRGASGAILQLCFGCIALGALAESTVFRLAKFDEIDFCNQSLGAVLAAIVSLVFGCEAKPSAMLLKAGLVVGLAFLIVGGIFAFL